MTRFTFVVLAAAILLSPSAFARDAFLYVNNGQAITNGRPVNNKALKAKYSDSRSYFWFEIDGKAYIVRDPNVVSSMKPIYAPVFETGMDFTLGEQMEVFTQQMEVMKEQFRIGIEPKPGEDAATAIRRTELKREQNRLGARQNELARRANAGAARLNDFAARLDDINRDIERRLHDLATQLIATGVAVRAY